jgi:hypothetical protein
MPLNGSGTYAAPASTFNPAVTNTAVNSTDWTALLADITTALSTALYKDGQATPTANIPMGGFKLTGVGAGHRRCNYRWRGDVDKQDPHFADDQYADSKESGVHHAGPHGRSAYNLGCV